MIMPNRSRRDSVRFPPRDAKLDVGLTVGCDLSLFIIRRNFHQNFDAGRGVLSCSR